jgi:light-harvesting complex I chlorophyll a/b binding protein 4
MQLTQAFLGARAPVVSPSPNVALSASPPRPRAALVCIASPFAVREGRPGLDHAPPRPLPLAGSPTLAAQMLNLLPPSPLQAARAAAPRRARSITVVYAADRPLWAPGVVAPSYLDGSRAGDRGFDPLGLGSDPAHMAWFHAAELVHARWAMLGAAGVLAQTLAQPDQWWYNSALPQNLPDLPVGGKMNLGGLLAWEFLLMHFVEVRRWQDIRRHGSVNSDPIFKGNAVPNAEPGYPGGIFDPLGFSKGNMAELKTKEIKNGRLAMVAFMGFVVQAQATGKNPLANLADHLASPGANNWTHNIGVCHVPATVDVQGLTIPLTCLWPGNPM